MFKIVVTVVLSLGCVIRCQEYSWSAFTQTYPVLSQRIRSQSEAKFVNQLREFNQILTDFDKNIEIRDNSSQTLSQMSYKYNFVIDLIIISVQKILSYIPIRDVSHLCPM